VGRIDGSIDGKNRWVNRGKNQCHYYTLLQVQQREEDETEDSERRKKKETSKNSSNLMLRIETAIKNSRVFCSSALLRDWEWNGFDNFLKLIRSFSYFCCSAMHSSLCSFNCKRPKRRRFGHEDIKKINPGLSRVWPGRPGPRSTLRVDRVWPSQSLACFLLRPGPTTDPGQPAVPGRVLKHWLAPLVRPT